MIVAFYPGAGGNRYLRRLLDKDWVQLNQSYDCYNLGQKYEYRYLTNLITAPQTEHTLTHCMNIQRIQQCLPATSVVFIKSDLQASLRREWMLHGHQRYMNQLKTCMVSRLDHYRAFKDPTWPEVQTEFQINQLPNNILIEVNNDYNKVIDSQPAVPEVLINLTQQLINRINSAYEIIYWHLKYYQKYPVDFSAAEHVIDIETDNDDFSQLMRKEMSLYSSEIFDQVWKDVYEQWQSKSIHAVG